MKKRIAFMSVIALALTACIGAIRVHGNGFTYTGSDLCKMCHKKLDNAGPAWDASKHAAAFKTLSGEEAKKYSANAATDEKCLACHTTGFGKDGGYKAAADTKLEGVGCESCHGAGSGYKGVMTKQPDVYVSGLITPSVAACVQCHNKKSPTFKEFHFQDAAAAIRHGKEDAMKIPAVSAAYIGNAKCVMCHKSRDNATTVHEGSKHAKALDSLKTDEAKKFTADPLSDPFCLSCHVTGLTDKGGYDPAAADEEKAKLAGVGCESCHGPGEKYMKTMKSREESLAGGMVIPSEKTCRKCHNSLSPTFKEFNYAEAVKAIAHKKN